MRNLLLACVVLVPHAFALSQTDAQLTENLVRQSDAIVVAKVTGLSSAWNADKSRIYTTVTLAVEEQLKGENTGGVMSLRVPGGEVDGVGEIYSHIPRFKMNEEVVLFARKGAGDLFEVAGGMDGKMTVSEDETTGLRTVAEYEPLPLVTGRLKQVVEKQRQE